MKLYPQGSPLADSWLPRFRRAFDEALKLGVTFPIQVGRDRFISPASELVTTDQTMEGLRFDFQTHGITWFHIDPEVEDSEFRTFLSFLNLPAEEVTSVVVAPAYLRERGVTRITVGVPSVTGVPDYGTIKETRSSGGVQEKGGESSLPPLDALEVFAESVLDCVDEHLSDLVYDVASLSEWLDSVSVKSGLDALYAAVRMLAAKAENKVDREIHLRAILEAIFKLPSTTYAALIGNRLIPMSSYDLEAFNLLTQMTEEELRLVASHVPQQKMMTLSAEMLEFPWEAGKRQRLVEAVTWTLRQNNDEDAHAHTVPLPPNDPILTELRQEIIDASQPEVLLRRSVDILLTILIDKSGQLSDRAMYGLAEAVGEALMLQIPELSLQVLSEVFKRVSDAGPRPEPDEAMEEFRRRTGKPTHVTLLVRSTRNAWTPEHIDSIVEYLRLVGTTGVEAFSELLAQEKDRRVRVKMCGVLIRLGAIAIPTLIKLAADSRWFLARNAVYSIGKIGLPGGITGVIAGLDHPHQRVRVEAVRAAHLVGGPDATAVLVQRINDPEPTVRRAIVFSLKGLGAVNAVPALQSLVLAPIQEEVDWEIKGEALNALAALGTAAARSVLEDVAAKRGWFMSRTERRLQELAQQARSQFGTGIARAERKETA